MHETELSAIQKQHKKLFAIYCCAESLSGYLLVAEISSHRAGSIQRNSSSLKAKAAALLLCSPWLGLCFSQSLHFQGCCPVSFSFIFSFIGCFHLLPNFQLFQPVLVHFSLSKKEKNDARRKTDGPSNTNCLHGVLSLLLGYIFHTFIDLFSKLGLCILFSQSPVIVTKSYGGNF